MAMARAAPTAGCPEMRLRRPGAVSGRVDAAAVSWRFAGRRSEQVRLPASRRRSALEFGDRRVHPGQEPIRPFGLAFVPVGVARPAVEKYRLVLGEQMPGRMRFQQACQGRSTLIQRDGPWRERGPSIRHAPTMRAARLMTR